MRLLENLYCYIWQGKGNNCNSYLFSNVLRGDRPHVMVDPGQVVNAPMELTSGSITAAEIKELFERPFMGGLDRFGVIVKGPEEEIRNTVYDTLDANPEISILAAARDLAEKVQVPQVGFEGEVQPLSQCLRAPLEGKSRRCPARVRSVAS